MQIEDLDTAWEEAHFVDGELKLAVHRGGPFCWAIELISGPHPGCAEFAGYEAHPCSERGEAWVLDWEDDGINEPYPTWEFICAHHLSQVAEDDVLVTYRPSREVLAMIVQLLRPIGWENG